MGRLGNRSLQLTLILGMVLSGCGGGDDDGGTPPATTTIAKAPANSGDAQTGTVAQLLPAPLQVVVTEGGAPKSGATVTWSTTAPGGSLDPATATTDASGTASATWALGTVSGPQSAQAASSGASGSPVSFTASAIPGAAAELEKISGDRQVGVVGENLAARLVAKVSDQFGNGVAGVAVGWSASDGSLSSPSVTTDQSGSSAVTVTLPETAGAITITATAEGLIGSPQTYTAEATEAPTTADVSVVNNSFNPGALTISAGMTVIWTWAPTAVQHNVAPTGGTEPARSGNPRDGPFTYQYTFNTPGTYNYVCEVHGPSMSGVITVQ
jgi:plastocyanin